MIGQGFCNPLQAAFSVASDAYVRLAASWPALLWPQGLAKQTLKFSGTSQGVGESSQKHLAHRASGGCFGT